MITVLSKIGCVILVLGLGVTLTSCVSLRAPGLSLQQTAFEKQAPKNLAKQLKALKNWQALGALSVQSQQHVGIGDFSIHVSPQAWEVHLQSNLNLVSFTMGNHAQGIWYTGADGKTAYADSMRALMLSQFGFAIPFKTMLYWLKGLPAPGLAAPSYNDYGQLQTLDQMGWSLSYDHYALYGGVPLPGIIKVRGHGEFLKIVIKKWTFSKQSGAVTVKSA